MTMHDNELLDPRTWLERVGRFLDGLSESEGGPERQLRQAYHLVRLAPEMVARSLPAPVTEAEFERMLAEAKFATAVKTFLGPNFVRTGADEAPVLNFTGQSTGRVCPSACPGMIDDRSLAMLRAWAGSFLPPQAQLN